MLESAGERLSRRAKQMAQGSLFLLVFGPSWLLVLAWIEVLNNPGYSLVDAYWVGREPWTWFGIVLSLAGGVAGLVAGSVAIAVDGGWWRRFLVVPSVAVAVFWWSIALGVLPFPRFVGPDPVTFAYSLPSAAALLILMPAGLLATLCLTPPTQRAPRTRLRRVPQREPWTEPPRDIEL
jgi:hypothetical protein